MSVTETGVTTVTATANATAGSTVYISTGRLKQLEYIEKNYSTLVALGAAKVIALEHASMECGDRTDTRDSDIDVDVDVGEDESDYDGEGDDMDGDGEEEEDGDGEEEEEETHGGGSGTGRAMEVKTPPAKQTVSDSFLLKLSLESLIASVREQTATACCDPLDI